MIRYILPLLAAVALAGCGAPPAATTTAAAPTAATPAPAAGPLAELSTFTQSDLANAVALAAKAGPAGAPVVACFGYLQTQLTALQTAVQPVTGTVGAATVFTVGYLGLGTLTTATSSAAQLAYDTACGPLAISVINQGMTLQAQIAGLVALVAKPL